MIVASAKRWALVHESPEKKFDPSLEELLPHLSLSELSLVLVEGFKHEPLEKIELHHQTQSNTAWKEKSTEPVERDDGLPGYQCSG